MPSEYIILIAAGITATAGIVGVIVKNRHDLKLKKLEAQQKKDEQYLARKVQAGEAIIRKWSIDLERLQIKQQFYEAMANPHGLKDPYPELLKAYEASLNAVDKKAAKEAEEGADLYHVYFDIDLGVLPKALAEQVEIGRAELSRLKPSHIIEQELNALMAESLEIHGQHNFADEPERKAKIDYDYAVKNDEIWQKMEEMKTAIKREIDLTRESCFYIREMMKVPQI